MLPLDKLTESEKAILQKHLQVIGQFQALIVTRQQAVQDILAIALEARGFNSQTHRVAQDGTIEEIPKV